MKIEEFYCKKFNLSLFVLESFVMSVGPKRIWQLKDRSTENPNEFLHNTTIGQITEWALLEKIELQPYNAPKPEHSDGRYITPKSRVNNLKVFIDEVLKIDHKAAKELIKNYENDFGKMRKGQKREFYLNIVHDFTKVYCS